MKHRVTILFANVKYLFIPGFHSLITDSKAKELKTLQKGSIGVLFYYLFMVFLY